VDLNTCDLARERTRKFDNVEFVEADIASMDLGAQFDIVICIGVIHHTDDPDRTFMNLLKHCKEGGRVIVWTYSAEGNGLVRFLVEPLRKLVLRHLGRGMLSALSAFVTILLYPFVYTIYMLPFMRGLPYFQYFANFRRLSFRRNVLNVFDKLNAPQVKFTTLAKCHEWFAVDRFEAGSISIRKYVDVSYSLVGTKRKASTVPCECSV
jgi:SAM-dependent methyltransferase